MTRRTAEAPALQSPKRLQEAAPVASEPAQLVAVLSLSRSGSSLVSRILHEVLRVDLGETIEHIPANRNNPDGYFENAEILRLNEDILSAAGASVFRPPPLDYFSAPGGLESLVERARRLLTYYSLNRRSFGFKDPRLSLTFPVWKLAAPQIVPIIVFRDPGAAALSISDQNGIPVEQATALWFDYYARIFHYTAGLQRYVVSFERLLAEPASTVAGLAAHLGASADGMHEKLRGVVDPSRVRHSSGEPLEFSPYIDPETKLLYSHLKSVIDSGAQPAQRRLGSVIAGLEQFRRLSEKRRSEQREREHGALEAAGRALLATREAEHREQLAALERQHPEAIAAQEERHRAQLAVSRLEHQREQDASEQRHREDSARHQEAHRLELGAQLQQHQEVLAAQAERHRAQLTVSRLEHQREKDLIEQRQLTDAARREERQRVELASLRLRHDRATAAEAASRLEQLAALEEQLRRAVGERDDQQRESARKECELATAQAQLLALRTRAVATLVELEAFRGRRSARWLNRWLVRRDLWSLLTPAFQRIKDDSVLFQGRLLGYRLLPSLDLRGIDCLTYPLSPRRPDLAGVLLAVLQDLPQSEGSLGVEIVSPGQQIVAQSTLRLDRVNASEPVTLSFDALPDTGSGVYWLRVFSRECTQPIRILEWRRWGSAGTGPSGVRPFCGLQFGR